MATSEITSLFADWCHEMDTPTWEMRTLSRLGNRPEYRPTTAFQRIIRFHRVLEFLQVGQTERPTAIAGATDATSSGTTLGTPTRWFGISGGAMAHRSRIEQAEANYVAEKSGFALGLMRAADQSPS